MSKIVCSQCGNEIESTDKYCPNCGALSEKKPMIDNHTNPRTVTAKTQKWEYLELEVDLNSSHPNKANARLWYYKQDGEYFENSGSYRTLMFQLGREGWELVAGYQRMNHGVVMTYKDVRIFKRQII